MGAGDFLEDVKIPWFRVMAHWVFSVESKKYVHFLWP